MFDGFSLELLARSHSAQIYYSTSTKQLDGLSNMLEDIPIFYGQTTPEIRQQLARFR
jgi:hypothetical protein